MSNPMVSTSRAPLWVRCAVWVLFVVVIFSTLALAGQLSPSDNLQFQGVESASVVADTGALQQVGEPGADTAAQRAASDKVIAYYTNGCPGSTTPVDGGKCNPQQLLPTSRWQGSSGLYATYGFSDIVGGAAMINGLAAILFAIAGLLWAILFWLTEIALGFNVFTGKAMQLINDSFSEFAGGFINNGLIVIPAALALIYAVSRAMRGDGAGSVTVVLGTLMPVALLVGLSSLAAGDSGSADGANYRPATGSPVWIAQEGTRVVDEVAGNVGTGFGVTIGFDPTQAEYANVTPSCTAYSAALRDAFMRHRQQSNQTATNNDGALSAMAALWQSTYLSQWAEAQYGGSRAGSRIWCHQLDEQAGVERAVQVEIGIAAGYPSIDGPSPEDVEGFVNDDLAKRIDELKSNGAFDAGAMGLTTAGIPRDAQAVLQQDAEFYRRDPYMAIDNGRGKGYQASLFMFAGCQFHDGQIKAQTSWNAVGELGNDHCQAWWYGGVKPGEGAGGSDPLLEWGYSLEGKSSGSLSMGATRSTNGNGGQTAPYDSATSDNMGDIRALTDAYRGDNADGRLIAGIIALLTAVAYGYVIGGLAAGGLLAKVGVGIMLMLLPGTLILLAFPSKGQGRNPAGVRLLKMTVGFLAASVFLTLALVAMVSMITVIETLLSGFTGGFLSVFTPLIALLIMRFILKKAGLGDLASFKGQLGMTAAAGAAVGGSHSATVDARRAARGAERMPTPKDMYDSGKRSGAAALAKGKSMKSTASKFMPRRSASRSGARGAAEARAESSLKNLGQTAQGSRDKQLAGVAATAGALAGADRAQKEGSGSKGAERWAAKTARDERAGRLKRRLRGQDASTVAQRNKDALDPAAMPGASNKEKSAARAALMEKRAEKLRAGSQVERDTEGNPLLDAEGNPIFGFNRTDKDGNVTAVSAQEAGFDPKTGKVADGFGIENAPRTHLSDLEAGQAKTRVAQSLGLDPQQVLGSTDGLAPIPGLRSTTDSDSTRLPVSSDIDATAEIARDSVHWLSDENKLQLAQANLSETAKNRAVHQLLAATGGIDPETMERVDFLATKGIDLSTDEGMAELQNHVDGKPSQLDNVHAEVPAHTMSMIIGDAQKFDREIGRGMSFSSRQVPQLMTTRDSVERSADVNIDTLSGHAANVAALSEMRSDITASQEMGQVPAPELVAAYNATRQQIIRDMPDITAAVADAQTDQQVLTTIDYVASKATGGYLTEADVAHVEQIATSFVPDTADLDAAFASGDDDVLIVAADSAINQAITQTRQAASERPEVVLPEHLAPVRAVDIVQQAQAAAPSVTTVSAPAPKRWNQDSTDDLCRWAKNEGRDVQLAIQFRDDMYDRGLEEAIQRLRDLGEDEMIDHLKEQGYSQP